MPAQTPGSLILSAKAGGIDRRESIVRFALPDSGPRKLDGMTLLNRSTGEGVPMQLMSDTEGIFILDQPLARDTEREYELVPAGEHEITMRITANEQDLEIMASERPVLVYNITSDCPPPNETVLFCRSGFIHPIFSPGGAIVTDDFPVGHRHQHGLFSAWVNTTFREERVDFWNQHAETGTAAHQEVISTVSGSVFAGFSVKLHQISRKYGPVLQETWEVAAYDLGDLFVLDLVVVQKNVTKDTLFLNRYHYGGLGLRGSRLWNRDDDEYFHQDALFLTSEGKNRLDANHSRPRWTAMYGTTGRGMAGIAVLDHPTNLRHPQPVRVHPEMPYFSQSPVVEGGFHLPPGGNYESRYRIVAFDGPAAPGFLDATWLDYAMPIVMK